MFNIVQLFLTISNDPHSMLLNSVHYCSKKSITYVTLLWRCALNVSGQINHHNTKTKVYHKRIFLSLQLTSWLCSGYDANECLSPQTQHSGYFIPQVGVTKLNNIFLVRGEKKTTQPALKQRYRLLNYTQNAAGNFPFTLDIH
jgi:hypothetical protein